jgi:putative SOS response-associated peptidase YedK
MCNLYRLDAPANQIAQHCGADPGKDPWAGGYIAPKRPGPVVVSDGRASSARWIRPMLWGFPPPPQGRAPVTNVRNLTSPFWIGTLRHAELRCLVPVTAFQEWSGDAGAKRQHWFSLPASPIFAFAGIFRVTDDWPCFAFLTCEPNRLVGAVHPKAMPLILHPEDYETWLTAEWQTAQKLVAPFPSQLMRVSEKPPIAAD